MKKIYILMLLTILTPSHLWAYDKELVRINIREDYADCALFYQYAAKDAGISTHEKENIEFQSLAQKSTELYVKLMADKTTPQIKANIDLHNMKFKKILQEEGFDRLIVIYSDFCKMMFEKPQKRVEYWENKQ